MLIEEELTYKLRGIFYKVAFHNGYLYKESAYHNLLLQEFVVSGIKFINKPKIPIYNANSGKFVCYYIPDFLIEDKVIVEIKAQSQLLDTHVNQLIRYLNCSVYELGFVVNFGSPKVQIERRVYSNERKKFLSLIKRR